MIGPESMSAERTKHSPGTESFCGIVGRHRSIQELAGAIEGLSRLRTTVLITGESGTGKELVARAIHLRGDSPGEPFVGINCGAFTRSLLEDQLFGHVRGAFTGAAGAKDGVFVSAAKEAIIQNCVRGVPDLLVEVISGGSWRRDRIDKKALYEQFGVAEYWIIEPDSRLIEVFALREGTYQLHSSGKGSELVSSQLLPGLAVSFDELER